MIKFKEVGQYKLYILALIAIYYAMNMLEWIINMLVNRIIC